jgi:hypothetical protein
MVLRLTNLILFLLFLYSCSRDPVNFIENEDLFDNPLDSSTVEYDLPALTFFPNAVETGYGQNFSVQIFALGYDNLAGSHVFFEYDPNRVEVSSLLPGTVFSGEVNDPIFFMTNDTENGIVTISTALLASDSSSVSALGSIAQIELTALATGQAKLQFLTDSEMVGPNDNIISTKGFGEAIINIQ